MWLLVRSGPDEGAAVPVTGDVFVLGRQHGCDLVIRDARASRRHAELRPTDGGLRLRDLGSANGTLVDGRRTREALLIGGEELRIGDVRIDVARGAPPGGARRPEPPAAVPTHSAIRRLVEHSTRRARRTALAAAALAIAAAAVAAGLLLAGGDDAGRVPEVVARLGPATALVVMERDGVRTGSGSGWVLDAEEGLIVTSAHVVNEGNAARVAVAGRLRDAEVHAAAPCADLAVLRVGDTAGLQQAPTAPPGSVEQGEPVVALGHSAEALPGDPVGSTTGVVSVAGVRLPAPAPDVPTYDRVIQTDTALNPGNSGGPLADLDGRVVAVNAAARTTGASGRPLQNVNYAIPMAAADDVLETLRAGRGIAWTGLTFGYPTDAELAAERLPPGLRVTGRSGGGAAPGVPPGSLLVGVAGRPVRNTLQSYCDAVAGLQVGDEVALDLIAPGRREPRRVTLPLR